MRFGKLNSSGGVGAGDVAVAISAADQNGDITGLLHLSRVQRHVVELAATVSIAVFVKFDAAILELDVDLDVSVARGDA